MWKNQKKAQKCGKKCETHFPPAIIRIFAIKKKCLKMPHSQNGQLTYFLRPFCQILLFFFAKKTWFSEKGISSSSEHSIQGQHYSDLSEKSTNQNWKKG